MEVLDLRLEVVNLHLSLFGGPTPPTQGFEPLLELRTEKAAVLKGQAMAATRDNDGARAKSNGGRWRPQRTSNGVEQCPLPRTLQAVL